MCISGTERGGGIKHMSMPFEIFSIVVWLGTFSETCLTAVYSHLFKYHMLGFYVTDECL